MTKAQLQLYGALGIAGLWLVGIALAYFDGSGLAKVTTPMMTAVVGWLFTDRATQI